MDKFFLYTQREVPKMQTIEVFILEHYKDKDERMRTYNRIKRAWG